MRARTRTENDDRFRWIERWIAPLIAVLVLVSLVANARLLNLDDDSTARRALLLSGATQLKWTFTMAYLFWGAIVRPWSDNVFAMRAIGVASISLCSLIFAFVASAKAGGRFRLATGATLFLGCLGVYGYSANSLPEYNHLAIMCALGIGAIVIRLEDRLGSLPVRHCLLLSVIFAIFMATNLPSSMLIMAGFAVHRAWPAPRSRWADCLSVVLGAGIGFLVLRFIFREFALGQVNPGVRYNELALQELGGDSVAPGNMLYLFLRTITYGAECVVLAMALGVAHFLGRRSLQWEPWAQVGMRMIPLIWLVTSALMTMQGLSAYQTPDLWDFSPAFFLGKVVWYGYATLFPLAIFMALSLGQRAPIELSSADKRLMAFFVFMTMAGCFGSGARIIHKAYLYEWSMLFPFFLAAHRIGQGPCRVTLAYTPAIVGFALLMLQFVPIVLNGGLASYDRSLADLPRGKGILARQDLDSWSHSLSRELSTRGVRPVEKLYTNDLVAAYLLGLDHVPVEMPCEECRYGLLNKTMAPPPGDSKITRSALLKVLGPPHINQFKARAESLFDERMRGRSFEVTATLSRGDRAQSILYRNSHPGQNGGGNLE